MIQLAFIRMLLRNAATTTAAVVGLLDEDRMRKGKLSFAGDEAGERLRPTR
jgi:hypothetical protein